MQRYVSRQGWAVESACTIKKQLVTSPQMKADRAWLVLLINNGFATQEKFLQGAQSKTASEKMHPELLVAFLTVATTLVDFLFIELKKLSHM